MGDLKHLVNEEVRNELLAKLVQMENLTDLIGIQEEEKKKVVQDIAKHVVRRGMYALASDDTLEKLPASLSGIAELKSRLSKVHGTIFSLLESLSEYEKLEQAMEDVLREEKSLPRIINHVTHGDISDPR